MIAKSLSIFAVERASLRTVVTEVFAREDPEFLSHLDRDISGFALDLTGDRVVLTADTARAYPSESLLALEDVTDTLLPLRGAEIIANPVAGFGAGDIEVAPARLAFGFGGVRVDAGGRIEGRLPGMVWRSADALPKAIEEHGR
ncbi:MAG: hypothetical protein AAFP17_06825 [Pseudomonadota bacterium]